METVAIVLIIILFFLGHYKFKELDKKNDDLEKQIKTLKKDIFNLSPFVKNAGDTVQQESKPEVSPIYEPSKALQEKAFLPPKHAVEVPPASTIPPASPIPPPPVIEPSAPLPPKQATAPPTPLKAEIAIRTPSYIAVTEKKEEPKPKIEFEPYKPSALEEKWQEFKNNVDWEQFTGVKLFAWLGSFALFIGAIFFVKYSIDNNLIPPQLRLAIGALVGLAMIIASLIVDRVKYNTTAHTMAAGGIAVLYAVSFTATVYYGFLPKLVGFGLVALISAAAFVLAVFHKGRFISVLGAIGAYATPLLIQTGHPNLVGLFIYLTVVNIGLFEVIRRTGWLPLSVLVTVGTLLTLSAGAWGTDPPAADYLISIITIANLLVFSLFFRIYRGQNAASRSIILSLRILFVSVLLVAMILINTGNGFQYLPFLLVTAATLVALILSYMEESWSIGFLLYAFAGFVLIAVWSYLHFDLSKPSWEMLIFFMYSVIAGLGPVFIIHKHGIDANSLSWLKIFPAALAAVAVIIFLKSDVTSFFFWPMLLGIGVMGIFISMLVGSIISVAALILLLLIGGVSWIFKTPVIHIGNEFFIFILLAGLLICFLTVLFLKNAAAWSPLSTAKPVKGSSIPLFPSSSEWITAVPVLGPFLLLTLVLLRQYPVAPNPAMAAGLCFFAVAIFLARYFKSQEILTVALAAMSVTILSWGLKDDLEINIHLLLLGWSSFLWLAAVMTPNILCRSEKDWKIGWYAWAVFELILACLVVLAADNLWEREIAGWIPLALAALKLPVIVVLLKRLEGKEERNSILAFHGGVLLFYVSSISVLLLGSSWIGVAFVIEAMLLLWLNRRIEHPGLRWVSLCLAPLGLALLLFDINTLKSAQDLPVLNLAVFSCALCVVALSLSVKWADYPQKEIAANFSLPEYFLWLAIGAGFFLANMIVSDIFGGVGGGFKLDFYNNINQYISHTLLWTIFGSLILRIRPMPPGLKTVGLIVMLTGVILSLLAPFHFSSQIGTMTPLVNPVLIIFIPIIAAMIYLAVAQADDDWGGSHLKNLFITLGVAVGLLALTVELSTIFNHQVPFDFIIGHSSAMTLAIILTWFLFGLGLVLWPRALNDYFRLAGAALILISLARAVYYPLGYTSEFGAVTPLLNIPTGIFLLLIAGLAVLTFRKFAFEWTWNNSISPRHIWAALLILFTFYVTNVQVASVFGMFNTGADSGHFTFYTHGRLSQQLAYSISWLVFAIILLIIGIRWQLIQVRWVALSLLVMTALKVFIKDLWALGQLYRVFAFIGLAVTLILVSFIYQRYLGGSKKSKGENE
ncbi:MAG: DUF2339 domain-containing protein [Deltaproteobacteria bacterium]|nr:DUF2339 domain-containing protein [Deltaproteobacteria bacterium]